MIKLSFTIRCFVLTIICLIILSYYELENIKIKEEIKSAIKTEDISEQFNTTMSYVSKTNTSRDIMENIKIIYLVTQHDKKSQGKKQIKFSKGFFRQSKFKYIAVWNHLLETDTECNEMLLILSMYIWISTQLPGSFQILLSLFFVFGDLGCVIFFIMVSVCKARQTKLLKNVNKHFRNFFSQNQQKNKNEINSNTTEKTFTLI